MSLALSYLLASKVRAKLTKDASNPKTSLRTLVVQANMLDNLMDHIASQNTKRAEKLLQVKFDIPHRSPTATSTTVQEYEVEEESDSDFDSDFDSESDSDTEYDYQYDETDEEEYDSDDYYYSSEEEEEEEEQQPQPQHNTFKLSTIEEEPEMPELSKSSSSTDESDHEHDNVPGFMGINLDSNLLVKSNQGPIINDSMFHHQRHYHQRHDAIHSITEVF